MSRSACAHTRWRLVPAEDETVARLSSELGVSPVTARVLVSRGIADPAAARRFLRPSVESEWPAEDDIPGLAEAAERVTRAVRSGERIVVFGDFDLDGISAAAVALLGLRTFGADVVATVPHRFREGYGLTPASLDRLAGMAPDLVVTVDCGISSGAEVEWLRERGIDAVVTDHHEPGDATPGGIPVANPKLASAGPPLAGAGVALALVRAVGERLARTDVWRELTDLAMLGTVADIVPLLAENRALVADGIARTRTTPRVGVAALAAVAGIPIANITAERVAFGLAPRLNAAGRMADPGQALDLLVTEDAARAEELAQALDEHNKLRKAAESDLMDAALDQAESAWQPGDRIVVVAGEDWHEGVRGIVASRLVARFGVPALVFCLEDGMAEGSGRSVPGVDLHALLEQEAQLLSRYGGHAAAVGLGLPAERVDELRARLSVRLAQLPADTFMPELVVDGEAPLDALGRDLAHELASLAPFGFGNPAPVLVARGVFMNGRRRVGTGGDHFRFTAYDGVASVPAIYFRCRDAEVLLRTTTAVDVAFVLEIDTWQGRERVQMRTLDVRAQPVADEAPAAELVADLFEHADEVLARGEYTGIGEAEAFHTKLAGVTFEGRQEVVARLAPGTPLRLERQPDNAYDANACALFDPLGDQVGFFNRRLAAALAPFVDAGVEYDVSVTEVTGGADDQSLGVNVLVARRDALEDDAERAEAGRARRDSLARLSADELTEELRRHFIGDRALHAAQSEALAHLERGDSTLAVMATGRGKSLIFHLHAARVAVRDAGASVFVYPLRALVADQAFHLTETFAGLGLAVRTVTGETTPTGRDEAFSALGDGTLDLVLTTPEFLDHHAARFANTGRVRFVVVDEAHHVGLARTGHRPAYGRLGRALEALGDPLVLACTATAGPEVADTITRTLGVRAVVADATVRENLAVRDVRGCDDKKAYVASLAATGEKVIVYANSRDTTVDLARTLRSRVPGLAHHVAFYNGGLTRSARHAVEEAFRDGSITTVVATSAFGEGVNIPDVRHVVLYHLPFNDVEFNQMCGRGGRDGAPAMVHALYGKKDARINRMILESMAPERDELAALYLALKDIGGDGEPIEVTNADLAERACARVKGVKLTDKGVSAALGIFRELGLIEGEGTGIYRRLVLLPAPDRKLDLASSVRYAEGRDELAEFDGFKEWALGSAPDVLLAAFNRPILP